MIFSEELLLLRELHVKHLNGEEFMFEAFIEVEMFAHMHEKCLLNSRRKQTVLERVEFVLGS